MRINDKQIAAVIALPGERRFEHFIKTVVSWEEAWGLYDSGWALAANEDEVTVFPLWPAKEYASICAAKDWGGYEPRAIPLSDLIEILLPKLKKDGVLPGVFYTPSDNGVIPSIEHLIGALKNEMLRY